VWPLIHSKTWKAFQRHTTEKFHFDAINATAAILLCCTSRWRKKQSANLARISGTVQNTLLKEYIARGT